MSYDYAVTRIMRVVDGDTVDLEIDLGFYLKSTLRFRLLGCDSPERHEAGWAECTAFTREWLTAGFPNGLRAITYKSDDFGRWLAIVRNSAGESLSDGMNKLMAEHGWTSPAVR